MKLLKLGAGVLNQTPLDWIGNCERICRLIDQARQEQVSILCLPELCISGYGCEDAFYSPGVHQTAWEILMEILPSTRGIVVSLGLPLFHRGGIYNVAALVADQQILGLVGKQNLAGEGLHYEPRWFKPWPEKIRVDYVSSGPPIPLGDLMFDVGGVGIGFEICEDAWVANRPGGELAQQGIDVLLNPSASHFAFGKHEVRRRFVLDGSRAFSVNYVYANLLGNEAGRAIYDGDAMIASCGTMVACSQRFSFADRALTTALIDLDESRMIRARTSSFRPQVQAPADLLVSVPWSFPLDPIASPPPIVDSWEDGDHLKEEEFCRTIALGLFDYMRKSRSHGFVISLSGGADSAAVAILATLGLRAALRELGKSAWLERLNYIPQLSLCTSEAEMIRALVSCVYQATRNSGDVTQNAAREVANALETEFISWSVDGLVQNYVEIVSTAIGRSLTWEQDDVSLQNIQARVRGPSVWLLANLRNALLLATSNRSEAAVGYATMDGDTCGGLSPIAGIDKAYLRRWLRWMETEGPAHFGPLHPLALINSQQPTAELRPQESKQTDEQDLMPYELLDAIERSAIRDKHPPLDVFKEMRLQFEHYSWEQLAIWVERFFRLWCRNQWKRERYAPSFHLDDENLDPKTWCRFPILSGGYQRELDELRRYVQQRKQEPT